MPDWPPIDPFNNPQTQTHMSDSINTQTLTHMTDSVTPQPTAKDHLTNAQFSLTEVHNATVKLMRDVEEAKAALFSDTPAPSAVPDEQLMKRLIAFTWDQAISFAQDHVDDEVHKDISVYAYVDERVSDSLDISIRGEVETEVCLSDHIEIEIPTKYDGVEQTHKEILQGFLEYEEEKEKQAAVLAAREAAPEQDVVSHVADPHNQLTGVKVVGNIDLSKNAQNV